MEPFLIWFGGKRRIIKQIASFFPKQFNNYYEPFLGSGTTFLHLAASGKLDHCDRILLSDVNSYLVATWLCLQDAHNNDYMQRMLFYLSIHQRNHCKQYFNEQKQARYYTFPEIAANFIYINRATFGGIYRENSDGNENLQIRTEKPRWLHPSYYWRIQALLKSFGDRLQIGCRSFEVILHECQSGDFVYFDPPYYSFNESDKRSVYNAGGFTETQNTWLVDLMKRLTEKDVFVLQSNSWSDPLFKWYDGFLFGEIPIKYKVTNQSVKAIETSELLVFNYTHVSKTESKIIPGLAEKCAII